MSIRDRIAKALVGAVKTGGRYALRVGKGLTRHTAGQLGKQGARRLVGRHYDNLNEHGQKLVDECGEIAGRIVVNRIQDGMMIFGTSDFDQAAEEEQNEIQSVIIARGISNVYDGLAKIVIGKPDRPNNELILKYDVIKQLILAGIAEILEARQREFS